MRRSSRLITKVTAEASKEAIKGEKRPRESSGIVSEVDESETESSVKALSKSAKKRVKTESKPSPKATRPSRKKDEDNLKAEVKLEKVNDGEKLPKIKEEIAVENEGSSVRSSPRKSTRVKSQPSPKPSRKSKEDHLTAEVKLKKLNDEEVLPNAKKEKGLENGAKSSPGQSADKKNKMPSGSRSVPSRATTKFIGAHVSIGGGLQNAVHSAVEIGAKAFAMFLRSQRQWNSKPLDDKTAELFKEACKSEGFAPNTILPHGIYLVNCGSPEEEMLSKSRGVLIEELQRCEKLGLTLYNFHPGSTCGKIAVEECLDRIGESINIAHAETKYVMTVIENMSCQGNTVGGKFEELRGIIDRVKDKSRVGVCLDTCHAFAAGHNISTDDGYEQVMEEFDKTIGLQYLKAVHLNDSKGKLGCHLDRHENIGKGVLGRDTFARIMKDARFDGIPMILETPRTADDTYAREIKLLYSMVGKE